MKFNFWKVTTFVLIVLIAFVGYRYIKEYQKNLPYKKELKNFQRFLERAEKESDFLKKQALIQSDPLSLEKERKDKFGEANPQEKVILVSDELLKSIDLDFISH